MESSIKSEKYLCVSYDKTSMSMDLHLRNGQIETYTNIPFNLYAGIVNGLNPDEVIERDVKPYYPHYRKA